MVINNFNFNVMNFISGDSCSGYCPPDDNEEMDVYIEPTFCECCGIQVWTDEEKTYIIDELLHCENCKNEYENENK